MALRLFINNGSGDVEYTKYVIPGSINIEDSINTPVLTTFTLSNTDGAFVLPVRSAYVKLISTLSKYTVTGGINTSGAPVSGNYLATGYITNEYQRKFLGVGPRAYNQLGQHYEYDIKVTSDEYLLNCKAVPFVAAYINQTMGQILTSLAGILAPGFFDTTNVGSGDLIPYFNYDPTSKWSDVAKQFADQAQYRYNCIGKKIFFTPYNDKPLGITYNDAPLSQGGQRQIQFNPSALTTAVLSVPLVNDCLVIGDVEPQQMRDDYFVGDGFTGNFPTRYEMFHGTTDELLDDEWTEAAFNFSQWQVQDPQNQFVLAGALNAITISGNSAPLGTEYIALNNGLELGGHVVLQHGEFQWNDHSVGIVGGVYGNLSAATLANPSGCLFGFNITSVNVTLTASGANGIVMQPMISGNLVGTAITSVQNHHYILESYISARRWARYNQLYRTLAGTVWGDADLPAIAVVSLVITDIDLAQAYNLATLNNPFVPAYFPTITRYQQPCPLPSFGAYVLYNSVGLNCTTNSTVIWEPPTATLQVAGLTGARPTNALALTGGQLPLYDPLDPLAMTNTQPIGPYITYPMGFGMDQDIVATVALVGDTDSLEFYSNIIPGVGARIRFQAWQAGQALARVIDPVSVAREAAIVGDDGHRSAIINDMSPAPRTSDECALAAAAEILDRENPQWDGDYNIESYFWDNGQDFPRSGRFFNCTSPQRAISGQQFLVRQVTTTILEMFQEVYQFDVSFGQDLYLEKLMRRFVPISSEILEPSDTVQPPNLQFLPNNPLLFGSFNTYLNNMQDAVLTFINGVSITVDVGPFSTYSPAVTGIEIRRSDRGWGNQVNSPNLIAAQSVETFQLPRTGRDQTWYMRFVNGAQTSEYTRVFRVNYPLVPLPPSAVTVSYLNAAGNIVIDSPTITVSLPLNFDPDIYGVIVFGAPQGGFPCCPVSLTSSSPTDHRTVEIQGLSCPQSCVCGENGEIEFITEFITLNGTTPVTSVNDYILITAIIPFNGLMFSEQMTMTDGFTYFLGPNGGPNDPPIYAVLSDLNGTPGLGNSISSLNMQDGFSYLLTAANIQLLISENMFYMQDVYQPSFTGAFGPGTVSDSIANWTEEVVLALGNNVGGGTLAYKIIIAETLKMQDGVAHFGAQLNLVIADSNGFNWQDAANVVKSP